jgi:hypothetical protein
MRTLLTLIVAFLIGPPAFADPLAPADVYVIDGDTIAVSRQDHPAGRL